MQTRYCWRCAQDVPMLDETEFALWREAISGGRAVVEREVAERGVPYPKGPKDLPRAHERFRAALEMYELLTSFSESNPNAAWHHVIDQYGPDCPRCAKPLRTSAARYCAACGFGIEELTGPETLPLAVRRPGLFGGTGNLRSFLGVAEQ